MGKMKRYWIPITALILTVGSGYAAFSHFSVAAAEGEYGTPQTPVSMATYETTENAPSYSSAIPTTLVPAPAAFATPDSTTAESSESETSASSMVPLPVAQPVSPVTQTPPSAPEVVPTPLPLPDGPVVSTSASLPESAQPLSSGSVPLESLPPTDPFAALPMQDGMTTAPNASQSTTTLNVPQPAAMPLIPLQMEPEPEQEAASANVPPTETLMPTNPMFTPYTNASESTGDANGTAADNGNNATTDENGLPPLSPWNAVSNDNEPTPLSSSATGGLNESAFPALTAPRQFEEQQALAAVEGSGKPGEEQFDGLQKPQVVLEKTLPDEVIVGNTTTIQLAVRNPSDRPLYNVTVRDEVPERTRFAGSTPQAQQDGKSGLLWNLGTLEGGEERNIEIQLVPLREGEFGSVATVQFACSAGGRSRAVQPRLEVDLVGPERVLIGQDAVMKVTVTNTGTGTAKNVFLFEQVPAGFRHVAGEQLENQLGDLRPGESQEVELSLTATGVGPIDNTVAVRGDGGLTAEKTHKIEILAPALDVAATGAKRRFLKRETTYTLSISNPGTADATGVTFSTVLPLGVEFVRTNNEGAYDAQTRTVHWALETLPAGETGDVELVVLPTEAGEKALRICGAASNVTAVEKQMPVLIEGVGAFSFEVTDLVDPVELGEETVYRITLSNNGSKEVTGIRMTAGLSSGLELISIEGAISGQANGSQIVFDTIPSLMPEVMQQVLVRVRAKAAGDQRLRVQARTDDVQQPVTKEETTQIFAD